MQVLYRVKNTEFNVSFLYYHLMYHFSKRYRENVMISSMFNVSLFLMYHFYFRYIKSVMISSTPIVSLIHPKGSGIILIPYRSISFRQFKKRTQDET